MNLLLSKKFNLTTKINYFLILILPISLLVGSGISNALILLISFVFLIDLYQRKNFAFFKDYNFYFLIIIYFYLILNAVLIAKNLDSIVRAIGFLRFIILSYALFFYLNFFKKKIIKFWFIIFLIVSVDIIVEYSFGKNVLGFSSDYQKRIASFTGDELKIGHFYFGFIFISLAYLSNKHQKLKIFLSLLFLVIALIIGERSNFIKIFIMYILFFLFFFEISYIKKFLVIICLSSLTFFIIFKSPQFANNKLYNNINLAHIFQRIFIQVIQVKENYVTFKKGENIDKDKIIRSNQHFAHYYTALQIFNENKLFGSGIKTFRIESFNNKYNTIDKFYGQSTHPHQMHFEFLSELGIVGYILIISNLIYILRQNIIKKKDFLIKAGILYLTASLIPMLPSGSFFTSYGAAIFWINYSFLIKKNRLKTTE